jgi:hypothetical protein
MQTKKCNHESCNCAGNEIRSDGYCSDSCKGSAENGGGCNCGHPSCSK